MKYLNELQNLWLTWFGQSNVASCNKLREENLEFTPDLAGRAFTDIRASGAWLMGANMNGSTFSHCDFSSSLFQQANAESCVFVQCDLRLAQFGVPEIVDAKLMFSPLGKAFLNSAAHLFKARLENCQLGKASFIECNLNYAYIACKEHNLANFKRAHMEGCILKEASVEAVQENTWERMSQLPLDIRKSYFLCLWLVATADDDSSTDAQFKDENEWLLFCGQKLGITEVDFDQVKAEKTVNGNIDLKLLDFPTEENDRVQFIRNVLLTMEADHRLSKEEQQVAEAMAWRLGFNPSIIQNLLDTIA
jgi:uncharacterized protein YjbI with pentapeptide repeats